MPTIPADIPENTRPLFERLLAEPRRSEESLREDIDRYLAIVRREAAENEAIEVDLAEVLGARLRFLLGDSEDAPATYALIQAVTRYFVVRRDAEDDLRSEDGFYDDAALFNAVVEHLRRPDLKA